MSCLVLPPRVARDFGMGSCIPRPMARYGLVYSGVTINSPLGNAERRNVNPDLQKISIARNIEPQTEDKNDNTSIHTYQAY
jgi:hypothetical protein